MSSTPDIQEVWTKREVLEYRVSVTGAPRHFIQAENLYVEPTAVSLRFVRNPDEWWRADAPVLIGRLRKGDHSATYMESMWNPNDWPAWLRDMVARAEPRDS